MIFHDFLNFINFRRMHSAYKEYATYNRVQEIENVVDIARGGRAVSWFFMYNSRKAEDLSPRPFSSPPPWPRVSRATRVHVYPNDHSGVARLSYTPVFGPFYYEIPRPRSGGMGGGASKRLRHVYICTGCPGIFVQLKCSRARPRATYIRVP